MIKYMREKAVKELEEIINQAIKIKKIPENWNKGMVIQFTTVREYESIQLF